MSVRPFLIWPDRRLRETAAPVLEIDETAHQIWADMLASMYAMPGVGLAAPQIGVMQALAVVDCSEGRDQPIRMANPELIWASDTASRHQEGSPNLPGHWAMVERPSVVRVRWLDEAGNEQEREFDGLWATSVQHQLDHLAGRMFIDRLSATKRRMILAKHEKSQRKAART